MKQVALQCATLLSLGLSVLAGTAIAEQGTPPAPPDKVVARCQSCHGRSGDSVALTVPRLNGQRKDYIVQRLNELHDPTREDPHATATMGRVMSEIDNGVYAAIAAYYAEQPPTQAQIGAAHAAEGRKIYLQGAAAQNIAACASCHGARGEGVDSNPRLAGQHAVYLTKQLERLRLAMRESKTMYHDIKRMTDKQIEALVAYLGRD